jgi:hypothetical protein
MHEDSGKIYSLERLGMTEEEARARGLVPIPKAEENAVRSMNRHERRKWAAEQRKTK